MSQTCHTCKQTKPDEAFSWRKKNVKRSYECKECHRIYNQLHYQKNKDRYAPLYRKRRTEHKEAIRNLIWEWLQEHPCIDCGETDPVVLEFDHAGEKDFNIGAAYGKGFALQKVLEEIKKCEVRCANCHRRKSSTEGGWWKSSFGSRSG